jgi:molybdate transport system substrate-binding protein
MRERIEAGDKVDIFTSADIGHAAKLVADGKASVMAMFARNDLCLPALTAARSEPGAPFGDVVLATSTLQYDCQVRRSDMGCPRRANACPW